MTLPDAENSAVSPALESPVTRIVTEWPVASFIWQATVRFQISSYSRKSSPRRPVSAGVRKLSPAGRTASCASWAFFTLLW